MGSSEHQVLFYFALGLIAALPLFYNFGKWLVKENGAWGKVAESLITLAAKLQEYGLDLIPDLLRKIATRNLAGAWKDVVDIVRLFEMSPDSVIKMFDKVFARVLVHKLTDPAAVALLSAQINDAKSKLPPAAGGTVSGSQATAA